jgi:organic radical activating enzyme
LALAAGEFVRIAGCGIRCQADPTKQFCDTICPLRLVAAVRNGEVALATISAHCCRASWGA